MTYDEVLRVGDPAPELGLPGTHGTPVTLASLRGAPALLVFFPFAFSGLCTDELTVLEERRDLFDDAGVTLLGISCDPVFSLRAWRDQLGLGFALASDFWPHGDVAGRYGVFDDAQGRAVRGSFLLDADGVLRWSVVNPPGEPRPLEGYVEALARLAPSGT